MKKTSVAVCRSQVKDYLSKLLILFICERLHLFENYNYHVNRQLGESSRKDKVIPKFYCQAPMQPQLFIEKVLLFVVYQRLCRPYCICGCLEVLSLLSNQKERLLYSGIAPGRFNPLLLFFD